MNLRRVRNRGCYGRSWSRRTLVRFGRFALLVLFVAIAAGCRKKETPSVEVTIAPPVVNDVSADLMLTWIDDKGEFHVEQRVNDVPEAAREAVRVRDPGKDPLSGDRVYVADLRAKGPDGSYAVKTMTSQEFEAIAVKRREKNGVVLVPRAAGAVTAEGAPSGSADVAGRPAVIVYGASWCGPCHQAIAYLKKRGVSFVEHVIEKDSSAAREMQAKLAKVGARGGSIPVLDVRGRILVGFDANAVEQALARP